MDGDIEVKIRTINGNGRYYKKISCADPDIERYHEISKTDYIYNGVLIGNVVYNSNGVIIHETEWDRDDSFQKVRHRLPSGYSYEIESIFGRYDDDFIGNVYTVSIIDESGRPHGIRGYQHGKVRWANGHPETAHEMYIFEDNTISEGRIFFTPLGDGFYLLDYYYIDCDQEITERLYNIYWLNIHGPVNLVFEKNYEHTFEIREKGAHERYIDYNIPVQFMFQHYITPTEDRKLYALQKKEVDAYLEAHGYRPEDYDKSTPYYESFMEYYNNKIMQKEDKYGKEEFKLEPFTLNFEDGEWRLGDEEYEEDEEDDI
jgi:hypothetical protein